MKELIEEQLDAPAMQEWPELPNVLGQWPYLAMSRLQDDGFPLSMEGDVDAAITLMLAYEMVHRQRVHHGLARTRSRNDHVLARGDRADQHAQQTFPRPALQHQ